MNRKHDHKRHNRKEWKKKRMKNKRIKSWENGNLSSSKLATLASWLSSVEGRKKVLICPNQRNKEIEWWNIIWLVNNAMPSDNWMVPIANSSKNASLMFYAFSQFYLVSRSINIAPLILSSMKCCRLLLYFTHSTLPVTVHCYLSPGRLLFYSLLSFGLE